MTVPPILAGKFLGLDSVPASEGQTRAYKRSSMLLRKEGTVKRASAAILDLKREDLR